MMRYLRFILRYFFFFTLLSVAGKLCFLAYQWEQTSSSSVADVAMALARGLQLDASFSAYVSICCSVFYLVFAWNTKIQRHVIRWFSYILITLCCIVMVADFELYRNWNSHIDASVIQYLATPAEAMASTPIWLTITLLLAVVLMASISIVLFNNMVRVFFTHAEPLTWEVALTGIFVTALLVVPMRGSLGIAPVNTGSVFFSTRVFDNHVAVNPLWNFMYSMGKLDVLVNRYVFMEKAEAEKIFHKLRQRGNKKTLLLRVDRPNVIIIMMESLSARVTWSLGRKHGITPRFDSLAREGVLFGQMYAASYRTDKGLVAVLCGYPAQPLNSIIKFPDKTQKLSFLSRELSGVGYSTAFVYGGDKDFSNINSLLLNGGIEHVVDVRNFAQGIERTKWGVFDEDLMNKSAEIVDTMRQPFFCTMLTQTNHEPFELPTKHRFSGDSDTSLFYSTAYYADSCLGNFIDNAKRKPWWSNTLVVVVADHSSRLPGDLHNTDPRRYHIPMLWLGGALSQKAVFVPWTCAQTDVAATLLGQMNVEADGFRFSNNILDSTALHYALFTYYDGFGFVTDSGQQVYDNEAKRFFTNEGHLSRADSMWSRAYWQVANDDFLGK